MRLRRRRRRRGEVCGGRRCLRSVSLEKRGWVMECGGDWKHLAPLRYVRMNDEMGVHSCGLDGEAWEGETLFTAITLLSGRRRSPRLLVFASAGLIFVFLSTSVRLAPPRSSIASLFFSHLLVVVFIKFVFFLLFHQLPLCWCVSSCAFPLVSAHYSPLVLLQKVWWWIKKSVTLTTRITSAVKEEFIVSYYDYTNNTHMILSDQQSSTIKTL